MCIVAKPPAQGPDSSASGSSGGGDGAGDTSKKSAGGEGKVLASLT